MLLEQRAVPATQLSHCPIAASQTFGHVCDWIACPSLLQWFHVRFEAPVHVFVFGVQMSHCPFAASHNAALMHVVLTQLFWSVPHFCRVAPPHMTWPVPQTAQ